MRKEIILFVLLTVACLNSCSVDSGYNINSPDKRITVSFNISDNALYYNLVSIGDTLLRKSKIGLAFENNSFSQDVVICSVDTSSFYEKWETVNGKNKKVINNYNQIILHCRNIAKDSAQYNIEFRCFDDGVAFRYSFPGMKDKKSNKIYKDVSEISFTDDFTFWAYNGESHNVGPVTWTSYNKKTVRIPVVVKTKSDQYIGIHEAAILNMAPIEIRKSSRENTFEIVQPISKEFTGITTSWRTLIIGERPGDLIESDLLVNLNDSCKISYPSWVKPGKSMWDWRVWGYKALDGFEYGLNTVSHKRLIDFASKNNIQYLLIDADWYGPEFDSNSDPTKARKGVNVEECMKYAKEKGVGVILYLNDVGAKKFGLERVIKQFSEWGAAGVKYGFMTGTSQEKVIHTREIVKLCAKYKLMVVFHDNPVPPSGDRRTFPNLIAKEFCHAQADAKCSYFPETIVTSCFVNMLAGPLDMTNGWFGLNGAISRPKVFKEIPGTVAAEVAKLIVIYSGLTVLPDSPEEYLKKEDLFDCIRKMPSQFDSYKVLDGEIGKYIIVARQSGLNWFIGSLTNRDKRTLNVDFRFLPKGESYQATFYEDTQDTHFLNNKESYRVRKDIKVNRNTKLKIYLAPGGGNSIWLKKL